MGDGQPHHLTGTRPLGRAWRGVGGACNLQPRHTAGGGSQEARWESRETDTAPGHRAHPRETALTALRTSRGDGADRPAHAVTSDTRGGTPLGGIGTRTPPPPRAASKPRHPLRSRQAQGHEAVWLERARLRKLPHVAQRPRGG